MDSLTSVLKAKRDDVHSGISFVTAHDKGEFLSYHELYWEALRVLRILQLNDVSSSKELIILVEDNRQFILLFWACILGGIYAVPVSLGTSDYHKLKVFGIWKTLRHPYLITNLESLARIKSFAGANDLVEQYATIEAKFIDSDSIKGRGTLGTAIQATPDDIAYIQFSSGSTGDPKGVTLTHWNLLSNISDIINRSQISGVDSMLSWMPLTHDMGLTCVHLTGVVAGINQHLMPTSMFVRTPTLWMSKASELKVSLLYSPNFGYHYLLEALERGNDYTWDLSHVKLIYNGAEPVSSELCERFVGEMHRFGLRNSALYPGYGLAEASVAVTLPRREHNFATLSLDRHSLNIGDDICEQPGGLRFVTLGYPLDHCKVRVCNAENERLPEKRIGHIQIKGTNVTKGYYENISRTDELFTNDSWLKTGDVGFFCHGELVITGRFKSMIKLNGQNYYPQDIEAACYLSGVGLGQIVACGVPDRQSGVEELVLFVLYKGKLELFVGLVEKLKRQLHSRLGLSPSKIVPVKKIHKTTSGKVQRFLLIDNFVKGEFDSNLFEIDRLLKDRSKPTLTTGSLMNKIITAWELLFGYKPVSVEQNFYSLGISSIQLTRLALHLQDQCNTHISVADLLKYPSLSLLGNWLKERVNGDSSDIKKSDTSNYFNLSHAQLRFWFIEQTFAEQSACNLINISTLKGVVDVQAFEDALTGIAERHGCLNASITVVDDQPRQYLNKDIEAIGYALHYEDCIHKGTPKQILARAKQDACKVRFDLSKGPLFKTWLYRIEANEYLFVFVVHHIIFDGWSFEILLKELYSVYISLVNGKPIALRPLKYSFSDFIQWNSEELKSERSLRDKAYWLDQLKGELPIVDLPFAKRRPNVKTFNGDSITTVFSADVTQRIKKIGEQNEVTLFVVLVSILNTLLFKCGGNTDIILGTDLSGRTQSGFGDLIGHFLNTVALRTKVSGRETFTELIQKTKNKIIAAFEHQLYPLDKLIEDLKIKKDISRFPIFDILVLFQNFEHHHADCDAKAGFVMQKCEASPEYCLYDLQFEFSLEKDTLSLNIAFNTDLYQRADIELLVAELQLLTSSIEADTSRKLFEYEIISQQVKQQLLHWSAGKTVSRTATHVLELFGRSVALSPDRVALVFEDIHITYNSLNEEINRVVFFLRETLCLGPSARVALMLPRSESAVIFIFAVLRAGSTYIPLDPEFPSERIKIIVGDSQPHILFTTGAYLQLVENLNVRVALSESVQVQGPCNKSKTTVDNAYDLAYIMYTSGSTGLPKGVGIEHRSLLDYAQTFIEYFELTSDDVVIQQAPLTFDSSIEEIFPVLCVSGTLVISASGGKNPEELSRLICREKATLLSTTPGVLRELKHHTDELRSLKVIISGGDVLQRDDIDALHSHAVYNSYGPTESTVCATYGRVQKTDEKPSIGMTLVNRQIYILDGFMQILPVNTVGQIYIGGCGVARGYINRCEETVAHFVRHPFLPEQILYKTGDLGKWKEDGNIEFIGREDDQVKIHGYRIELNEIKVVILSYPPVTAAELIARENPQGQKYISAYVLGDSLINVKELRSFLADRLPLYMIPPVITQLDHFPVGNNGKIDLRSFPVSTEGSRAMGKPMTRVESELLKIWNEVLESTDIGTEDNFFYLSGDSLKAIKVVSRIRKEFNVELNLKTIFLHPTIQSLAEVISVAAPRVEERIAPIEEMDHYDVSHGQRRLLFLEYFNHDESFSNKLFWEYNINGPLDYKMFESVFRLLVDRHESLRTTFITVDASIRQKVHSTEFFNKSFFNFIDLAEENSASNELERLITNEAAFTFDLERGPLIRVVLVRTSKLSYKLLCSIHHIIADAWSMSILLTELTHLYSAMASAETFPILTPLPIQYKDYAYWHNQFYDNEGGKVQRSFWVKKLEKNLRALTFPSSFANNDRRQVKGNFLKIPLDAEHAGNLRKYIAQDDGTLYMHLVGVVSLLLYIDSNENEFLVGTTVAGRPHVDLENQVGFFVNTLPIHISIDDKASVREFLCDLKIQILQSLDNQLYPYDLAVRNSDKVRREMIGLAISSLNMEEVNKTFQLCDSIATHVGPKFDWRHDFDLTCILDEIDDRLQLFFLYKENVFDRYFIVELSHRISSLSNEIVRNPNFMISELSNWNSDEETLPNLSKDKLESILEKYLK